MNGAHRLAFPSPVGRVAARPSLSNGVGKPVKAPRNGGMSESGSVRNTTLPPALGTLGPTALGCTVDASRAWKREILHDGPQARTVFFFGSLFRTLVWAWHDRVYGGTVLQASCLTACQFGISVLKTVLVFSGRGTAGLLPCVSEQ